MTLTINKKTYEAGELVAYVAKLEQENAELKSELHRVSLNEQLAINNGKNFLKQIAELEKQVKDLEWQLQEVLKDNDNYQADNEKLEKENSELKTKTTALENANRAMVKELDDTTSGGLSVLENVVRNKEQLTKAKELLKWWVSHCGDHDLFYAEETERFIKDSEVNK